MTPRLTAACSAALLCLCTQALAGVLEATVSTASGMAVEDAAVVVEPVTGAPPKRGRTVSIEQRDREFAPYVTIVQTGTSVEFPNRDAVKHHVYSFSPAKLFEIKLYAGKPTQPILFDKPGEVALGCNIHDWMEAYVLVVDSPYFGKTDRQGKVSLANIPPGAYRLRVWHPRQKVQTPLRDLVVGAAPVRLSLTTEISARVSKPKPPVEADKY